MNPTSRCSPFATHVTKLVTSWSLSLILCSSPRRRRRSNNPTKIIPLCPRDRFPIGTVCFMMSYLRKIWQLFLLNNPFLENSIATAEAAVNNTTRWASFSLLYSTGFNWMFWKNGLSKLQANRRICKNGKLMLPFIGRLEADDTCLCYRPRWHREQNTTQCSYYFLNLSLMTRSLRHRIPLHP